MKYVFFFGAFFISLTALAQHAKKAADPVDFVNPLMGSDSKYDLSNGNTYPAIALPWGMNFWTPQTGVMGDGWQYTYDAHKIRGFKQTHQPSPWMNDYGQFSIMPVTAHLKVSQNGRASWFSHKAETSRPYYYSVYLADHDVTTEIAPTERCAQFQFTFPKTDSSFIVIDAFDKGSFVKVIPSKNKIVGYSTRYAHGPLKNFKNYFVIYADKPIAIAQTYSDSTLTDSLSLHANHAIAVIGFKTVAGEKVHLKVASSFISQEQAELNLKRELGNDSFDVTERKDRDNHIVHYSPYTGEVTSGYMFAGTGFWDTFRALYPFINLVYPDVDKEMQEGLINDYKEGGWLPEWSSPAYANVMVGNNSASVVSGAYLKGERGYDISKLYEALIHGANNEGPNATGRKGVEYYNKLGYVPYDVKINENAARTLEYAYDDFCIYQLAKKLNRPAGELALYKQRSMNYRNLFDPSTGLMRGKNKDGTFQSPFKPFKRGDAFTEGNSWHYTWGVFHDIQGLINLMGGQNQFIKKLDSVFTLPPVFDDSYYGGVIHEMREMQIVNMGQYAHGNEPIQHMLYLYAYAGQPWKTQFHVRDVMNKLYMATPDGYCGDEDNGQTSAWYVFSAIGFYPVCPASDQYVLGAPLFKKITLNLVNGKKVVLNAANNSDTNLFINSLSINGKPYDFNWLSHADLMQGAVINFNMSSQPNKKRGIKPIDFPYSLSNEK